MSDEKNFLLTLIENINNDDIINHLCSYALDFAKRHDKTIDLDFVLQTALAAEQADLSVSV